MSMKTILLDISDSPVTGRTIQIRAWGKPEPPKIECSLIVRASDPAGTLNSLLADGWRIKDVETVVIGGCAVKYTLEKEIPK